MKRMKQVALVGDYYGRRVIITKDGFVSDLVHEDAAVYVVSPEEFLK